MNVFFQEFQAPREGHRAGADCTGGLAPRPGGHGRQHSGCGNVLSDFKILITFHDFKMSIFQDFEIFQDFKMSIFQDFGIFQVSASA